MGLVDLCGARLPFSCHAMLNLDEGLHQRVEFLVVSVLLHFDGREGAAVVL